MDMNGSSVYRPRCKSSWALIAVRCDAESRREYPLDSLGRLKERLPPQKRRNLKALCHALAPATEVNKPTESVQSEIPLQGFEATDLGEFPSSTFDLREGEFFNFDEFEW
jgi:hypothetical protein